MFCSVEEMDYKRKRLLSQNSVNSILGNRFDLESILFDEPICKGFKTGHVGILGLPNVGKSTLMNCLLKENLSIVSRKVQTTRQTVGGIVNGKNFQIIFEDNPGLVKKAFYSKKFTRASL